jgi:tetratricopeptide (TPR) repeat protein
MHRRYLILAILILAVGAAGIAVVVSRSVQPIDIAKVLAEAEAVLAAGNFSKAERLAQQVLAAAPDSPAALLIAGRACMESGRIVDGLTYLDRLPAADDDDLVAAHLGAGQMHNRLGHSALALQHFEHVIAVRPRHVAALREQAMLLTKTGRRWESRQPLVALVKMRQADVEALALLGNLEIDFDVPDEIDRYLQSSPDDIYPRLAQARYLFHRDQLDEARAILRDILTADPSFLEAHVWYGWTLVDRPDLLAEWHEALPDNADDHPLIWVVRGIAADNREQPRVAIRCFCEALRRDANLQTVHYRLAQLLVRTGSPSDADAFRERGKQLADLYSELMDIFPIRHQRRGLVDNVDKLQTVAALCESLGRNWEAAAWHAMIVSLVPGESSSRSSLGRLNQTLTGELRQTLPEANPAHRFDLSHYPLPSWQPSDPENGPDDIEATGDTLVVFRERALELGIDFVYDNGHQPNKLGMPIYQVTGGGVGVVDFDGDGWQDVYFTQGGAWPSADQGARKPNRLYRNLGTRFEEVTLQTGLDDTSFGQGTAVGDIDGDGFADLYVANLGQNRLYRNNGDGTFDKIATDAGLERDDWTTSCLIADLNGDGLPDVYDVNYVDHKQSDITRLCDTDGLAKRTCPPRAFPAAQDRVFVNAGDGTFHDVTESSGIVRPLGYGLGIVAANFGNGRLDLFIANDDTPNCWFVNKTQPGEPLVFRDQAEFAGLAVDRDGQSQACMGVAAGDADGDGQLDLFVTNFHNQSNTLYRRGEDWFDDWTVPAGLRTDSFAMLGFGTQFVDGELDGWPDLVIANGHVDDYSYKKIPFKMRSQFFQNLGGGRFREISAGPFFEQARLGRGLARLDWNRDGLEDIAISHIGDPAALLTNETEKPGHFLAICLRGAQANRDAIGSIIEVKVGDRTIVRQLTAGDGYQASNSRQLIIGLGAHDLVDELIVRWPGGSLQRFDNLQTDSEWVLVQGSSPLRLGSDR